MFQIKYYFKKKVKRERKEEKRGKGKKKEKTRHPNSLFPSFQLWLLPVNTGLGKVGCRAPSTSA